MAKSTAILSVRITGNSRSAVNAMRDTERTAERLQKTFQSVDRSMDRFTEGFETLENVEPLITALETIGEEANLLQNELQRTAFFVGQVDDASEGAAGKLGKFAEAYGDLVGASEGSVREVQNTLLAFENVRDTLSESTDMVDRATVASHDLAAALGTDAASAAEDVGQALQDPIDGLDDLENAGIRFSDAQKEMIANLLESGDLMGAQKVVLEELEDQFGGAAEATTTSFDRLMGTFQDFAAQIGTAVGPALENLADWLEEHEELLIPFTAGVIAATAAVVALNSALLFNPVTLVIAAIAALTAAVVYAYQNYDTFREKVDQAWNFILEVTDRIWNKFLKPIYEEVSEEVRETLIPAFSDFRDTVVDTLKDFSEQTGITLDDVREFVNDVEEWFEENLPGAVDLLGSNWKFNFKAMGVYIRTAAAAVALQVNMIKTTLEFLMPIIRALIEWWRLHWRIARDTFNWIWEKTDWWRDLMIGAIENVIDWISSLIDWFRSIPTPNVNFSGASGGTFSANTLSLRSPMARPPELPDVSNLRPVEPVVQVFLEGREIRNAVRRVVERAIDYEGDRIQAGAVF